MKRQMPDGSYREVGAGRAGHRGTPRKTAATKLGGSRAGRRVRAKRGAA